MFPKWPMKRYRPVNIDEGHGTFIETLGEHITVYGITVIHEGEVQITVNSLEDVKVGDIVEMDAAKYRVIGVLKTHGALYKQLQVERIDKPIVP